MLPLVTSMVSQSATPQPATAPSSSSVLISAGQSASASAARQQLAVAVTATGAPSPFSTKTGPYRTPQNTARVAPEGGGAQQSSILPDHPVFDATPKPIVLATPLPAQSNPLPALQQQQAAQFTAQVAAQQVPAVAQEQGEAQRTQQQQQQQRRLATLPAKRAGVANSTGLQAYEVAGERNFTMSFPATVEKYL